MAIHSVFWSLLYLAAHFVDQVRTNQFGPFPVHLVMTIGSCGWSLSDIDMSDIWGIEGRFNSRSSKTWGICLVFIYVEVDTTMDSYLPTKLKKNGNPVL
jgi:hypothetical protein